MRDRQPTFLFISLLLTLGTLCGAESPAQHTWKTYTNVRFQYSICYPEELLIPQEEAPNSDGRMFLAKDGAKLAVFGSNNALDQSLEEALKQSAQRLAGDSGRVTYKNRKNHSFVISGKNGGSIFYAKTIYRDNQFKSFELIYPASEADMFKPVVTRLASCFVNTTK